MFDTNQLYIMDFINKIIENYSILAKEDDNELVIFISKFNNYYINKHSNNL